MNVGLFGGTFDPIHVGHIALAEAARDQFQLGRVLLVPASAPPHKQQTHASYFDRYAMVALAASGRKHIVPSLLESPEAAPAVGKAGRAETRANYTIDTIRRLQRGMKKADRLFLLIGIDAFKDIAKWRDPEEILRSCEMVIASRAGYTLSDVANFLPESLRPKSAATRPFQKQPAKGDLVLPGATLHLLEMHQPMSATGAREAIAAGRPLGKLLDTAVAEYIRKTGLYKKT
jgi:nicotinate-nucleotide adenylyltransferase